MLGLLLGSCHYTRYVPEGKMLLWENEIRLKSGGNASYEAENILKQQPNRSILGMRPSLAIYNWGDGTDSSFWGRLGNSPIIFDSIKTKRSEQQLQNYFFNKGYFQVSGDYRIEKDRKSEKAKVFYLINRGPRYVVDTIVYDIATSELLGLVNFFEYDSELQKGMYYDAEVLENERTRLRDIFRDHGYYNFSSNFISFNADTISPDGPYKVKLEMVIRNKALRQGDSTVRVPHQKHYIHDIIIKPDYSFLGDYTPSDTIMYRSYKLAFDSLGYKPRYLTDAIHFAPGEVYRYKEVKESYSHLASYNAFTVSEITFRELPRDTGSPQLLGFVRLSPRKVFTFTINSELTNTSNNYGVSGSVGIINRNLFKSGEALRFDISSGLEYQPTLGNSENLSRTFELGAELSLDFPRFVLPFNTIGLVPKRMQPQSTVSLYGNRTSRIEFDRETFGGRLSYRWRESELKTHRVTLLNLSYSRLFKQEQAFTSQLNPIQQLAFQSEFISSTSWSFTYSGQSIPNQKAYNFFKSDLEVGGTLLSTLAESTAENQQAQLLDAPVYQFGRLESDYRYYWQLGNERVWIQRLLLGYVLPYGNSRFEIGDNTLRLPPFSRFFFLGGSNDMRAWPAYRAGGGQQRVTSYSTSAADSNGFAIGTLKALFSSEYRFPIFSSLKGAVFMDAGNIWLTGGLADNNLADFEWDDLLTDFYIGSGFGLRLDLDFFVIRFDTGLKIRDPGYVATGDEWVIATKPVFPNLTYNIALGYPF